MIHWQFSQNDLQSAAYSGQKTGIHRQSALNEEGKLMYRWLLKKPNNCSKHLTGTDT